MDWDCVAKTHTIQLLSDWRPTSSVCCSGRRVLTPQSLSVVTSKGDDLREVDETVDVSPSNRTTRPSFILFLLKWLHV